MPSGSTTEAGLIAGAETIDMQEGNSCGVLLLHGFGDTPQTLRLLARDLHSAGYDVKVPLLPGHGRTVDVFVVSRRDDWLAVARSELGAMRARHSRIAVVGLSMGGSLAAILAAEHQDIAALVLLAPYVEMPLGLRVASASHWIWGWAAGVRRSRSTGSIFDPLEREKNIGYGIYTGRLLYELWRLAAHARRSLPSVRSPTLIIQSRTDPRLAPEVAERVVASLGAAKKRLVWVEGAGHIITVDYGHARVITEVREWLGANTQSVGPHTDGF